MAIFRSRPINPALAHEALLLENKVGTMLPCNAVVRDAGNDQTEVAAIDPVASMQAIDNPALKKAVQIVRSKLERWSPRFESSLGRYARFQRCAGFS